MSTSNIFRINNWKFYFLIALLVRGLILAYFSEEYKSQFPEKVQNGFVLIHNDYSYHLQPVDNYIETGIYYFNEKTAFAGRMPGYSFPYLILRLLFSQSVAISLLIMLQFAFSCFSVYLLARTAYALFKSERIFYSTFILFLLSTFTSIFDLQTISESFSVSALIAFFYFMVSYAEGMHRKQFSLCMAGLFLAWAIFLRPYLGLFIPIAVLFIYHRESGFGFSRFKNGFIGICIFVLPFIVAESAWIARNFNTVNKFIPLEDSLENSYGKIYPKCWLEIRRMIFSWGGQGAYFEAGSEAWWFRRSTDAEAGPYKFKEYISQNVSAYNIDSLKMLRALYRHYMATSDPEQELFLNDKIAASARAYREDFIRNNPYRYYVYKPLMGIKRLVFSSGSSYLTLPSFGEMTIIQKAIKLLYSGLYFFILFFGVLGLILSFYAVRPARSFVILLGALLLGLCGTIVFYAEIQEARYFIAAYPILLLFTSYSMEFILSRFNIRRSK